MVGGWVLKPLATIGPLDCPAGFREALRDWFVATGRDYPWRRTRDPWAILVAEIMLQQTQIATVLGRGYFSRFLERFPDPVALAAASEQDLLRVWEGLGYYRRARMLQAAARELVTVYGGEFPRTPGELGRLPGVGRYTAGAVASFAFDVAAPIVDGNVARVLARMLDFPVEVDTTAGARQLWVWAGELVDPEHPRVFNSALMELGQRICRPDRPACHECPVAGYCLTRTPGELPRKKPARRIVEVTEHVVWQADPVRGVLLKQETGSRRHGLWRLPERTAEEVADFPRVLTRPYVITHHKVTLHIHEAPASHPPGAGEAWQRHAELARLAMPAPFRRALDELLAGDDRAPGGRAARRR